MNEDAFAPHPYQQQRLQNFSILPEILHCWLNKHFYGYLGFEHLFICFLVTWICSPLNCLFISCAHLFIKLMLICNTFCYIFTLINVRYFFRFFFLSLQIFDYLCYGLFCHAWVAINIVKYVLSFLLFLRVLSWLERVLPTQDCRWDFFSRKFSLYFTFKSLIRLHFLCVAQSRGQILLSFRWISRCFTTIY